MNVTCIIRRAAPLLAALCVGLLVLLMLRPASSPGPSPAALTAAASDLPPVNAQPTVIALLAKARKLRAYLNAAASTSSTTNLHPSGLLRFVGMEPGWSLGTIRRDMPVTSGARQYVLDHRAAWGLSNPRIDVDVLRHRSLPGRDIVRLQQTYGGIPVFAAQLVVHLADGAEVTCISADPGMVFHALDAASLPLNPKVSAKEASAQAFAEMLQRNPVAKFADPVPGDARLIVYAPEVLGFNGDAELAWDIRIESLADSPVPAAARWIVSAENGETINRFELLHTALSRKVYDWNSMTAAPATVTRDNGAGATGNAEVDNAYEFIGQVYNFYSTRFGRDSFNGGGAGIDANVRVCSATQCPWPNANSGTGLGAMNFGAGFVTDDIVAHEFAHKVTEYESGLLYQNASGAINESLSDIFGELFDQSNTGLVPSGTDGSAQLWLIGEDRPAGAMRNMRSPATAPFSHPDRMTHENFRPPVTYPRGAAGSPDNNDDGGVHTNSGVGNKLCFLLCDGESFNGRTIIPLGSVLTLALFYEVNTNILTPGSDWLDLNFAIRQAAINIGVSLAGRTELGKACDAVEINHARHTMHMDAATNAPEKIGIPEVSGNRGPFTTLAAGLAGAGTGGTLKIKGNAGPINVSRGYTITQSVTLGAYDTFIAVSGATGTPVPPAPVILQAP
jgi:bacillolysin